MWYEVASMGRRSLEVVLERFSLGGTIALLVGACATGGQSQPGDHDGAVSRDAMEPLDSGFVAARAAADATSDASDGGDAGVDATASRVDTADGGEEGSASDDGSSPEAPVDAGTQVDATADGATGDEEIGDAEPGDGSLVDAATGDGASPEAGPCGTCQAGFTCGAGNYCVTPTGVPAFGHVFVIVLDNQPLSAIRGSASAPYLNGLMSTYAYATAYTTTDHPSLPNYIELTSGNTQQIACECKPGVTNSCTTVNCVALLVTSTCACPQSVTHLGDALDGANIPWREYAESMGAPCNPGGADGGAHFAVNHVPFLYYDDVFKDSTRCQARVRDYTDFAPDLLGGTIRFALISPNLCHDMHDTCAGTPVGQGDTWLSTQVPTLLATPGFASGGRDVLFIVGDEQANGALGTAAPIPFIVVSPLAKKGTTSAAYNHYALLATIEDGLGVQRLGSTQASATISDVWK